MAVGFQPSLCVRIVTESLASLYAGAESNPRDRVLGEVLLCQANGDTLGSCLEKLCVSTPEDLMVGS